jgi:hypothetical protein
MRDAENLYVADRDLGRVVVYGLGVLETGGAAIRVIGVQGGRTVQSPGGVAVTATPYFTSRLYVSDAAGNQVDVVAGVSRLAGGLITAGSLPRRTRGPGCFRNDAAHGPAGGTLAPASPGTPLSLGAPVSPSTLQTSSASL